MVTLLIENGADPEGGLAGGKSAPLLAAAEYGSLRSSPNIIKALLAGGSNPNVTNAQGNNALVISALNYATCDVLSCLIKAGCPINQPGQSGQTALIIYASTGSFQQAGFLLDQAADPYVVDDMGLSAMDYVTVKLDREYQKVDHDWNGDHVQAAKFAARLLSEKMLRQTPDAPTRKASVRF